MIIETTVVECDICGRKYSESAPVVRGNPGEVYNHLIKYIGDVGWSFQNGDFGVLWRVVCPACKDKPEAK